jgi:hypothetical protein
MGIETMFISMSTINRSDIVSETNLQLSMDVHLRSPTSEAARSVLGMERLKRKITPGGSLTTFADQP